MRASMPTTARRIFHDRKLPEPRSLREASPRRTEQPEVIMDVATLPDTDLLLPPVAHAIWDMKYRFKERCRQAESLESDGVCCGMNRDWAGRRGTSSVARD